jgi:transcriptional regulator
MKVLGGALGLTACVTSALEARVLEKLRRARNGLETAMQARVAIAVAVVD